MLGSLLSRALIMAFGYAYPAYQCYKSVEMNKPDIERLRFWCQYWILVALLTSVERFGDVIISWLPMYHEAKLAFFIYLWHPKTMGSVVIYNGYFQPYISQHEADIDQNLLELRVRASDAIVTFWRQGAVYGQARFFEILQYFAAQSQSLRTRPQRKKSDEQPQQQPQQQPPPSQPPTLVPTRQPSLRNKQQLQQQHQHREQLQQTVEHPEEEHRQPHRVIQRSVRLSGQEQQPSIPENSSLVKSQLSEATIDDSPQSAAPMGNEGVENSESSEKDASPEESPIISESEDADPDTKEVMMEDTIRVTRARLRKNVSSRVDPEAIL